MSRVNLKPEERERNEQPTKSRPASQSRTELPSSQAVQCSDSSAATSLSPASSDERLVQLCLAGEREAFDELNRRYYQKAYGEAFSILDNDNDALDAVQEAFLNVYTHLDRLQHLSSFWAWLKRTVQNAARNIIRNETCRRRRERKIAADHPTEETFTPLDRLLAKELRELLKKHSDARIPLIDELLAAEEVAYRRIAQRNGTTVWQVRQAILRLRIKLQEYLADRCG